MLALLSESGASAQHYIGIKAGYGGAMGRFHLAPSKSGLMLGRYTGGVAWKYYTDKPVVGGVGAELEYQMRGYRLFDGDRYGAPGIISDSTSYYITTRTVSTITLPLVWQPHLYFANRHVRVFLSAGVTLSYNLGLGDRLTVEHHVADQVYDDPQDEKRYHWEQRTTVVSDEPYTMQTARDVRWNYGFVGGFGFGVLAGRWEFFAEGRYYYGMSDILRYNSKYQFHERTILRSELDNLYITMGIYFRLGKGGITAPPLRRGRTVPVGDDDFRNIRLNM
jgi:hypothetical protein